MMTYERAPDNALPVRPASKTATSHGLKRIFCVCLLAVILGGALLSEYILSTGGWLQTVARGVAATCSDPATQWMVVLCLAIYAVTFLLREWYAIERNSNGLTAKVWLGGFLALSLSRYASGYEKAIRSTDITVLLAGIVLGRAVSAWIRGSELRRGTMGRAAAEVVTGATATREIVFGLLGFFAGAALWRPQSGAGFQYHGASRWAGVWSYPNTFGLLMSIGFVLAVGMGALNLKLKPEKQRLFFQVSPFLAVVGCCGVALFKSYSRGAWVATGVGIGYLVFQISKLAAVHSPQSIVHSRGSVWILRNWRVVGAIVISLAALCFWEFRFTEWRPARRVLSVANINDFSWRNRLTAWEGAIRMAAIRPFLGFGWGEAESIYDKEYCPPQLDNGAIQMNDYFMLGISAGVPALVCFMVYIGLSLRSPRFAVHSPLSLGARVGRSREEIESWLRAVCRAGAVVLLVGFWFDGGLFKLSTGSVFWLLLELGREDTNTHTHESAQIQRELAAKRHNERKDAMIRIGATPAPLWLKWVVGVVAAIALIETIVLLGTPFLPVSKLSLGIARHGLVPPKAVADLDFLAAGTTTVPGIKLRNLLQHASLANYNRQLVNWSLDDEIYRNYVLTPTIDPQRDGQLAWRRALWEYFYPPVRKEHEPVAAAEIVMKFLHNRITIVSQGPLTIQEMWGQQKADAKGFDALKVAAFRAVGIPARLNGNGQSEILADGKWVALQNNSEP